VASGEEKMCRVYRLSNPGDGAALFAGWQETMIDSCLQGIMGEIYAVGAADADVALAGDSGPVRVDGACLGRDVGTDRDKAVHPRSAMAMLGDFCFLAGEPDVRLVSYKPDSCDRDFMIMIPQDAAWGGSGENVIPQDAAWGESEENVIPQDAAWGKSGENVIPQDASGNTSWENLIRQVYGDKARRVTRYAIRKEERIWDLEKLREAVAGLSPQYTLHLIDEGLYQKCMENDWSRDLVAQYRDYEQYQRWGLGAVILRGQEIVAGASSYSGYESGIEIEIDTREDHRRKGLAYVCGARLILECCSRGLYPSWDAQNLQSVALAEKLGYHFDHAYTAYEIWGYGNRDIRSSG